MSNNVLDQERNAEKDPSISRVAYSTALAVAPALVQMTRENMQNLPAPSYEYIRMLPAVAGATYMTDLGFAQLPSMDPTLNAITRSAVAGVLAAIIGKSVGDNPIFYGLSALGAYTVMNLTIAAP